MFKRGVTTGWTQRWKTRVFSLRSRTTNRTPRSLCAGRPRRNAQHLRTGKPCCWRSFRESRFLQRTTKCRSYSVEKLISEQWYARAARCSGGGASTISSIFLSPSSSSSPEDAPKYRSKSRVRKLGLFWKHATCQLKNKKKSIKCVQSCSCSMPWGRAEHVANIRANSCANRSELESVWWTTAKTSDTNARCRCMTVRLHLKVLQDRVRHEHVHACNTAWNTWTGSSIKFKYTKVYLEYNNKYYVYE